MHVPIATKGYENLFVALANRKRVDGSTLCNSEGCGRHIMEAYESEGLITAV